MQKMEDKDVSLLEKNTDELCRDLMEAEDLDTYLKENDTAFADNVFQNALFRLCSRTGLSKAGLARRSAISEVYLHQVLSGRRKPSRDRLLCICIGAGASLEEVQRLLKQATLAPLYPRRKRDAIISYGVVHHTPLNVINDKLFQENEKSLY